MYDKLYMADRSLGELFESIREGFDQKKSKCVDLVTPRLKEHNRLSAYMSGSGFTPYRSFMATATPFLKEWLHSNTIPMTDTLFFKACCRDDGTVLLVASYNSIIGSKWLKIVTLEEFNAFVTK